MFNHIMIGTNDIDKSKAFYEKVLGVLGHIDRKRHFRARRGGGMRIYALHSAVGLVGAQPFHALVTPRGGSRRSCARPDRGNS